MLALAKLLSSHDIYWLTLATIYPYTLFRNPLADFRPASDLRQVLEEAPRGARRLH